MIIDMIMILEICWFEYVYSSTVYGQLRTYLLTDAPNSGLTRYSRHSSMHGPFISVQKNSQLTDSLVFRQQTLQIEPL